jgi:hypothetical protein
VALPIVGQLVARLGQEGALEQDQRVEDPIWGWRGGFAHRSSVVHGSIDRSAGNDGEGGLPVGGVDNSRFGKVAEAQADNEVVVVGVGHGLRRLPLVMPPRPMERLVSGS